jgi:peptide/nickel transport system substrate-binding protein
MGMRWGIALAGWTASAVLVGACSSSSSSQGTVDTTLPAATTAAASSTTIESTDQSETTTAAAEGATSSVPAPLGGTVTVGLDAEPPTLDPAGNSLSLANGSVYGAIYETLMSAAPGRDLEFGLAESLTESDDRSSWTLVVRDGVTFHDGTPFDAAAVKFNLERQKLSPFNGPGLLPLAAVDVVDDRTVTLELTGPWTALPSVLAGINGVMVSPTAAADAAAFGRDPVGTGPYEFVEWVASDRIVTRRFDDYWGEPAPLDELVFKIVTVEAARVAAFEAGELDAYTTIIEATADEAAANGAQVVAPPPTGYGIVLFNNAKPPFDDPRVRRALEIGYDRDAVTSAYQGQGYGDASFSPFVKDSEWWAAPAAPVAFDPDAARALLDDYGQPVSFTLKLLAGSQEVEDSIAATIEYWRELGCDVELEIVADLASYVTDVVLGNYDAVGWLGTSAGDPDSVVYNQFHTGGASNYEKYSNAAVDAALDTGRQSKDAAERLAAYTTVQQELRNDVPSLITSHGQIYIVASADVGGIVESYFFPSRTVSLVR